MQQQKRIQRKQGKGARARSAQQSLWLKFTGYL